MHKLILNEWIKIIKRPGTIVMAGLLLVSVIAFGIMNRTSEQAESNPNWKQQLTETNKEMNTALKEVGDSNSVLKQNYQQTISINEYRIENNLPPEGEYTVWSFLGDTMGFTTLVGLFTIIIASGIVANEFSWGTIKLLIIRPIGRFKLLLSKYITVLTFAVAMLAFLFISTAIVGLIFFGTGGESVPYLAYHDGSVQEKSMLLHLITNYCLHSIDLFMLSTMAFMISSVFRNNSLASGISIFLLVLGGTVTGLLAMRFDWAKYSLFANTDLTQYFDGTPLIEGMTLGFSIIMLIIYFIIFIVLAFTVFTKRDVAA
ncbi:ABC transporter permease subunit [Bacillus gobiensis]|uniref:ABC transporter permease n=1 Tax=Bacillus gobiensis TaxID=1441095 RepID=UPI003D206A36